MASTTTSSYPTQALDAKLDSVYLQAEAMLSCTSIPSTATADDLPGAGRTLGLLYTYLSRRLEAAVNRHAQKLGYGPLAIKERLLKSKKNHEIVFPHSYVDKKVRKEIVRLVKYTRSDVVENQELAFQCIIELAVKDDYFRRIMVQQNAAREVAISSLRAEEYGLDHLLSPSRRALTCLLDCGVNELARKAYHVGVKLRGAIPFNRLPDTAPEREAIHLAEEDCKNALLKLVRIAQNSPEMSFLAMRHIGDLALRLMIDLFSAYNHTDAFPPVIGKSFMAAMSRCMLHHIENEPFPTEFRNHVDCTFWVLYMSRPVSHCCSGEVKDLDAETRQICLKIRGYLDEALLAQWDTVYF